ncbi:HAMP domain-containing histidine kinase [Acidobacteria bacterium ACD]|nr:HAMP domain-containing histidine kinase [Acidobacteria bacterium ACD]
MSPASLTRRMALLAAAAAAVSALLGAALPAVVLNVTLEARERGEARERAVAAAKGVGLELAEYGSVGPAAEVYLAEAGAADGRLEVWLGGRSLGSTGAGPLAGPGPTGVVEKRPAEVVARAEGPQGTVVVAAVPRAFAGPLRWEVGLVVAVALPLVALAAGLTAAFLLARGLAPLRALAEDVAAIDPKAPFVPLPLRSADREVRLLTGAVNESGARMYAALAREAEFAAHAAHALRTPLTRLAAQTAGANGPLSRSVAELGRLVDGLLLLVRTGRPIGDAGFTVNLADVAREAASPARLPEEAAPRVSVEAPDEVLVRGDETLLLSAVEHLVDNALRYTRSGSRVRVAVSEVPGHGEVALDVVDEGPGPAPEALEALFAPFARGAADAAPDGTGIGLALVRRVAEAHGGTASARREGEGTRFEVRLPAWKPSPPR